MSEPIKIRATLQGEITDIRILLQHPMETGQRKDPATGKLVPAHFIQTFLVSANGKPLVEGQTNTAVSRNPMLAFKARGLKVGDKLLVSWVDSKGEQRSDEGVVGAA
ncbi:thiosulfate oxidation carrier complex protein SoxZ [Azospira restricta]|uniref:Thiosulfate oxidation carrier complex protein SoxZ n=1 Tax=Azospira restricta TaxID=404405 RepID=A0A974SNM5_9RHOO|nr:thiosulfate oxidation carrier complex protein SoxZ [Azospira restricta]QRJ63473.1 thiosulfate oxidation carrier complex protein SoxZ [Azospira restricta]